MGEKGKDMGEMKRVGVLFIKNFLKTPAGSGWV